MVKVTVIKATSSNLEEVFKEIMATMMHGLAHAAYLKVEDEIKEIINREQEAGATIEGICHSIFEFGYQIAVKENIDDHEESEE